MVYLFDNFDEKMAKMLAYKFIRSLGTKYDKSSTRLVTTSSETAACLWAEGMNSDVRVSFQKEDDILGSRTLAGKRPKAVPNVHLI